MKSVNSKSIQLKNKVLTPSDLLLLLKTFCFENGTYKLVSLFVALILWVSILGRRDFVSTVEVEVVFLTASKYSVLSQSVDRIKMKVSGPQPMIKKFKEKKATLTIDASDYTQGLFEFDVVPTMISIPQGLRITNLKPNSVKVELTENK